MESETSSERTRSPRTVRLFLIAIGAALIAVGVLKIWFASNLVVLDTRGVSAFLGICLPAGIAVTGISVNYGWPDDSRSRTQLSTFAAPFGTFAVVVAGIGTAGFLLLALLTAPFRTDPDGVETWAAGDAAILQFEGADKPILGRICARIELRTGSGLLERYTQFPGCHPNFLIEEVDVVDHTLVVRFNDITCRYEVDTRDSQLIAPNEACRQRYGV